MANKEQATEQRHDHPGGSGAVLGVRVMRNSSVQAISLVVAQRDAARLDPRRRRLPRPGEMARFGLLMFLAGLVTQVASLLVKPGTVRRTFGGGDDDDDDDDDDDEVSSSPPHTLGAGLAWAIVLGVLAAALIYVFRRPGRRRAARRPRGREPGGARRPALRARCSSSRSATSRSGSSAARGPS